MATRLVPVVDKDDKFLRYGLMSSNAFDEDFKWLTLKPKKAKKVKSKRV